MLPIKKEKDDRTNVSCGLGGKKKEGSGATRVSGSLIGETELRESTKNRNIMGWYKARSKF